MGYEKLSSTDDADHDVADEPSSYPDAHEPLTGERLPSRLPRYQPRLFWLALFAEHAVLLVVFVVFWGYTVTPPTSLEYQIATPTDNKTYPSGQISWSQSLRQRPCGTTPSEAIALGCHFDMLGTAWLPARCIDQELVDEFMSIGQWDFYHRLHGTEADRYTTYDPEMLGSITKRKGIWTTRRWHVVHCLYMFTKLNRALTNGWPVDGEAISEPHTEHCMGAFKEALFGPPLDPDEVEVFLEVIYPSC